MRPIPFSLALITAPTADVVTYDEGKRQCRVEHDEHRADIEAFIAAAVGQIDPAAGGWLGRALRPQTWELRLAAFPCGSFRLPYPPVTGIVSVKYDDVDGNEQVLDSSKYRLLGVGGKDPQQLAPAYATRWPVTRCQLEAVRIRFNCGHAIADEDTPDQLPTPVRQWVLFQVGALYDNRDGSKAAASQVDGLITPYRAYWTPPVTEGGYAHV